MFLEKFLTPHSTLSSEKKKIKCKTEKKKSNAKPGKKNQRKKSNTKKSKRKKSNAKLGKKIKCKKIKTQKIKCKTGEKKGKKIKCKKIKTQKIKRVTHSLSLVPASTTPVGRCCIRPMRRDNCTEVSFLSPSGEGGALFCNAPILFIHYYNVKSIPFIIFHADFICSNNARFLPLSLRGGGRRGALLQ